jgi:isoleucyl-tRNA synthetase
LQITLDGETIQILPEEVEVRTKARSGLAVAAEGGLLCALKTDLTPELVREGLTRELVRRVQDLRKEAGLDIADRICLWASASPRLAEAIQAHRQYIMGETLALDMKDSPPTNAAHTTTAEFDGEQVILGLEKVAVN